MNLLNIYGALPVSLQNMACFIEGTRIKNTRYNKEFLQLLDQYRKREQWSYERIAAYRDQRIQKMVRYAYDNTAYYKRIMREGGINPASIQRLDDLQKIPVLTKKIINANIQDFIVQDFDKKKIVHSHTSGTTGSAFRFYNTTETIHNQWAAFWRGRYELGLDLDTWCAQFASRPAVPIKQKKPPFYRMNRPCKQLYFSAFHENSDNLYYYYKEIDDRKIPWIHGYPSLITPLAAFMKENDLRFHHKMKAVTTGAENLLEHQEKLMKEVFGVTPYQVYGQSENVAIFSQKKDGRIYVDEDFSAVEFIECPTGQAEIVGTSLYNYAMPLIRYSMKDYVTLPEQKIVNERRVVETIDGRNEDYVYLKDGRKIGKLDHVFKDTTSFAEVQIRQKSNYDIEVLIVPTGENCEKDEQISREQFRISLGSDVNITYRYVDSIEKNKNGKMKFVVSEVSEK